MYAAHQTLLHKKTKKLWISVGDSGGSAWLWNSNDIPMMNEHGEVKGFKNLKAFTHVENEFGEAVCGHPKWDGDKIVGLDASLYKYVNMTDEEKQTLRDKKIVELVDKEIETIRKKVITKPQPEYAHFGESIGPIHTDVLRRGLFWEVFWKKFEHYDLGLFGKAFWLDNVLVGIQQNWHFNYYAFRVELTPEQLTDFCGLSEEAKE